MDKPGPHLLAAGVAGAFSARPVVPALRQDAGPPTARDRRSKHLALGAQSAFAPSTLHRRLSWRPAMEADRPGPGHGFGPQRIGPACAQFLLYRPQKRREQVVGSAPIFRPTRRGAAGCSPLGQWWREIAPGGGPEG